MCIVSLKSITIATKGKKALEKSNIYSEIVKLDPKMTKKGCSYGLRFDCLYLNYLEDVFSKNKIKYSEIFNDISW